MTGELIDSAELTDSVTVEVRFVDWDRPDHRDTQGHAVPKYSVRFHVERPDGSDAESFPIWGSIHEAETQELTGGVSLAEHVLLDALSVTAYGGPFGTVSLENDRVMSVLSEYAKEYGGDPVDFEETIRGFKTSNETARKFDSLGFDHEDINELVDCVHQATRSNHE